MRSRAIGAALIAAAGVVAPLRVAGATAVPNVRVNVVVALESHGGAIPARVPITLDAPSSAPVTLHYATAILAGDTATPGVDFATTSGDLTFAAGQVEKLVTVRILPDAVVEPAEELHVVITDIVGAEVTRDAGLVVIKDTGTDVPAHGSEVEFDPEAIGRGRDYVANVTFALSDKLDHAISGPYYEQPELGDGCRPGIDYVATTGSITIPAGKLSATATVKLLKTTRTARCVLSVNFDPITGLSNQRAAQAMVSLTAGPPAP